ncbi:MAG TPA: hypothetical protein VK589_09240 [Chryseolinea sp.]|nr:hypothetical protein [Chryseolinea sp.]
MKNRILINAILVSITLTGYSQGKVFHNGDKWIPPDFKASATTLLIIRTSPGFAGKQKEYLEAKEFMKESYPYPYEFAYLADTAKFADRTKYRYLLLSGVVDATKRSIENTFGIDFCFYDRLTKVRYPLTERASSKGLMTFKPLIRTIKERQ